MGARAPSGVNAVSVIDPSERLSASAEATLVHELQPDFRSSDALPATLVFTGVDALLLFVALAVVLLILVIGAATDYSLLYAPRFQAEATVQRLSTKLDAPAFGDQLLVGRDTAVALDTRDASSHDGDLIIPVVLAVIALFLAASTVLSFGTASGFSVLVFDFPGADVSAPLSGFVFLVALGVDCNVFLAARVRRRILRGARGPARAVSVTAGLHRGLRSPPGHPRGPFPVGPCPGLRSGRGAAVVRTQSEGLTATARRRTGSVHSAIPVGLGRPFSCPEPPRDLEPEPTRVPEVDCRD